MLELPDYKMPRLRDIALGLIARAKIFLERAGTTILSMMVLIWFLASFPRPPEGAEGPAINYSLAATIGHALEPITAPIGFNWQINVALIPGMAAREVAVAALGTVYAIEGGKEAATEIGQTLAANWSLATALALLAWYIFAPQCASTLAVIKRETGHWRWMIITTLYMLALAYAAALITYKPEWFSMLHLEAGLFSLLNETYNALDVDARVLSAAGARTIFDRASELLKIDPSLTFKEKLDRLQNEGHISTSERTHLDILTDAGSAAAHRGWIPTEEQLNTVMSIVETFIHRKFVLEWEVKRLRARIPPRKKHRKKPQ
jgi:hypothetical protein